VLAASECEVDVRRRLVQAIQGLSRFVFEFVCSAVLWVLICSYAEVCRLVEGTAWVCIQVFDFNDRSYWWFGVAEGSYVSYGDEWSTVCSNSYRGFFVVMGDNDRGSGVPFEFDMVRVVAGMVYAIDEFEDDAFFVFVVEIVI